jgi:hypothetical protein
MTMPDLIISSGRNPHVMSCCAGRSALNAKADHVGDDFQGSNETNSLCLNHSLQRDIFWWSVCIDTDSGNLKVLLQFQGLASIERQLCCQTGLGRQKGFLSVFDARWCKG